MTDTCERDNEIRHAYAILRGSGISATAAIEAMVRRFGGHTKRVTAILAQPYDPESPRRPVGSP